MSFLSKQLSLYQLWGKVWAISLRH